MPCTAGITDVSPSATPYSLHELSRTWSLNIICRLLQDVVYLFIFYPVPTVATVFGWSTPKIKFCVLFFFNIDMSIVKKEDKSPTGGKSLNSGDVEFSCSWLLFQKKKKKSDYSRGSSVFWRGTMESSVLDESWKGSPWKSLIILKLSNCIAFLAGIIGPVIEVYILLPEMIKTPSFERLRLSARNTVRLKGLGTAWASHPHAHLHINWNGLSA